MHLSSFSPLGHYANIKYHKKDIKWLISVVELAGLAESQLKKPVPPSPQALLLFSSPFRKHSINDLVSPAGSGDIYWQLIFCDSAHFLATIFYPYSWVLPNLDLLWPCSHLLILIDKYRRITQKTKLWNWCYIWNSKSFISHCCHDHFL